ncbi:MAG: DedA family protein [Patescibacteria group bacterium]|jgi:membrane protein YqaA with SNARE-associated domain|nr:DedA family protein [Patescibacteria group bacterium]
MVRKFIRNHKFIGPKYESFIASKPFLLTASILSWPRQKIRQVYGWMVGFAETKNAERALAGFSFVESSFFPIPPDPLLIAITTVNPKKWVRFATICTIFSVIGGLFGYLIGMLLFESVGQWVISTYHLESEFASLKESFSTNGFLAIFAAAFTPIPYKLITISAGVVQLNIIVFIVASIIGRGGRFFLVAFLMHKLGAKYKDQIEQYIDVLSLAFLALIILGFVAVKYIF